MLAPLSSRSRGGARLASGALALLLAGSSSAQSSSDDEGLRSAAVRLTERAAAVVGPGLGTSSEQQLEAAAADAGEAARLWARLGDRGGEARAARPRAEALHFLGSLEGAQQAAQRSVELSVAIGDERLQARATSLLGVTLSHLGDLDAAQAELERALELHRRTASQEGERAALHDLAMVHREKKELQTALDYQQRATDLARELGLRPDWAGSLINLAKLYDALGQTERALRDVETAVEVAKELGNERLEAWGLRVLGDVRRSRGEPKQAQSAYARSLALRRRLGDRRSEAMVLNQLAFLEMHRGDPGAALELYRLANAIARDLGDEVGVAATLGGIGEAQLALGQYEKAHATFGEELAIHQGSGRWRNQAAGLAGMARASLHLGELERGLGEAEQALERLEASRQEIADADLRAGFLEPKRRYFELAVDAHLRLHERDPAQGHLARAFEVSEQARSRTLLELVTESRLAASQTPDRAVLAQRRALQAEIASLQRQLVGASPADRQVTGRAEIGARLRVLDDERRRLDARSRSGLPVLPPPIVSAAEVPSELAGGAVLLHYLVGREGSVLFSHDGESLRAYRLPAESVLEPLVREIREGLERPSRLRRAPSTSATVELYRLLIAPAAAEIAQGRELVVVPDGPLHLLPFEVLRPGPRPDGGDPYLIERWAVQYAPSVSVLASLRRRAGERGARDSHLLALAAPLGRGTGQASASGSGAGSLTSENVDGVLRSLLLDGDRADLPPLPYATEEARAVARLFPSASVLADADATEEAIKSLPALGRASHLHFATHALVSATEPDRSGLVLSPGGGPGEDGLLQVWEILDLELSAELVVLSACETALGKEVRGEGIVGMSRAFFYAGASRLLASLWQVHDRSTHDVMVRFYTHLRAGSDAAEALRRAKLELIAAGYSHPFYWAPFVLVGKTARGGEGGA